MNFYNLLITKGTLEDLNRYRILTEKTIPRGNAIIIKGNNAWPVFEEIYSPCNLKYETT